MVLAQRLAKRKIHCLGLNFAQVFSGIHFRRPISRAKLPGLIVRPALTERRTVQSFMVRPAHRERLNLRLSHQLIDMPTGVFVIGCKFCPEFALKFDSSVLGVE